MPAALSLRLAALALLAWAAISPLPASAHAIVVETVPQVDAVVHAPLDVRLRFNSRIDRARSRLSLLDSTGKETVIAIDKSGPTDVMTAHLGALAPGAYRLRWQVLALDGHITRGDIPFTVAQP
ncbi:MAG TPA: copper resistance CopC family protein [Stellaceae bacterium]|nr:copper resistance CopC family protein [Stellaceae bacterium]